MLLVPLAGPQTSASPQPVLRRLLPSIAAMLILLMAGAGALLWRQQQQRLAAQIGTQIATASRELRVDLDNQAAKLAVALQPIAADPSGVTRPPRKPSAVSSTEQSTTAAILDISRQVADSVKESGIK